MALSTGTVLAGRYEITAPIATGGMGEVWRARDRVLDRVVAAKVLRSEYTGDPSFVARFRNEARHTAALSHPNIASVYDYGETEDERHPGQRLAFLVMELVEGQPLVTILHDEGRLPVDWTMHVLEQAADGLSAAHAAGVVHRDIKPGNLIVRPDGVVKLTDFGIARARDATPLTRTGMVVGTAQYLSPEQAQGFDVTAASDVYSLGVVGYECLTGVRPFDGTSQVAIALAHINRPPPPLPAQIPRAVRQLLERALAKDPRARFEDGAAFAAAIRAVAGAIGGSASTGTATQVVAMPEEEPSTRVLDAASVTAAAAVPGPRSAARTMPPLQGPPTGGDRWADAPPPAPPRRDRRGAWVAAALLVVLLLAGGAWFLLRGDGDDGGATADPTAVTSVASTAPTSVATLLLDVDELLGADVDDAEQLLTDRGFTDVRREAATAGQLAGYGRELDPDGVAAVEPGSGQLAPDTPVTLYFAPDGYSPPAEDTGGGDGGSQPATSSAPAPTTSSAPAPTTAAPTTATPSTSVPLSTSTSPPPLPGSSAPPPTETSAATTPPATADAGGGG